MSKTTTFSSQSSMHQILIFLFFSILLSHGVLSHNDTSINAEKAILLKLKEHWLNPRTLDQWNSSSCHCNWRGITCIDGSVTEVNVTTNEREARHEAIPAVICELKNLTHIDLHYNFAPGVLATSLRNCSNVKYLHLSSDVIFPDSTAYIDVNIDRLLPPHLEYLDLGSNFLQGSIPAAIGNMTALEHLDLSNNFLTGRIPSALFQLKKLRFLSLSYNNLFSGGIPAAIGNMTALEHLDLSGSFLNGSVPNGLIQNLRSLFLYLRALNMGVIDMSINCLTGTIPDDIGKLERLRRLDLSSNGLSGKIPAKLVDLANVREIALSDNLLTGDFPVNISSCKSLRMINFKMNQLSGYIPSAVGCFSSLDSLDLSNNKFFGEIPRTIGNLSNLRALDLSNNKLSGNIPPEIGHLSSLSNLQLFRNTFSGAIPPEIGRLSSLSDLGLSCNIFSGAIPPEIGRLSSLSFLELSYNKFSGAIPPEIGRLSSLGYLELSYNKFSGAIPPEIGRLSSLRFLELSYNKFSGAIPPEIGRLSNLGYLELSYNKFSGAIPPEIGYLPNLGYLELSYNKFSGAIPPEIGYLSSLNNLLLSHNKFSGAIPPEIGHLSSLNYLLLSHNKFSGAIPPEIGRLSSLQFLDLSDNELSGKIPYKIGPLTSLGYLDLSDNKLCGEIPPELGLLSLSFVNLSSNLLCGSIPGKLKYSSSVSSFFDNPNPCSSNPPLGHHLDKIRFLEIFFSMVSVVVLLTIVFTFYIWRRYKLKRYKSDSTWKLIPFEKFSFTESTILSSLSENNLIGCGGAGNVYRVQINTSGRRYVAVKRIHNDKKINEKLEKQFLSEVQILGTVRHLNILRLMCCISSENSKLLVYEYMENGSLDQWLHCRTLRTSTFSSLFPPQNVALEWPKRLHIAIGAAQGLCYMHHCSSSPIIHRDLKSSNILLDSDFNAKIADFGLARILDNGGAPSTMSVVAGTFGYIAPECAQTARVNQKVDVYSFGVILLELVTGRKAHQGDEYSSLAEWAWRHIQQENPIVDALDENIKDPKYLDQMIKVFKLGICCTHTLPSNRPTMREVQEILHLCAHPSAPRENSLVPIAINPIRETRIILFSLQTGAEIVEL